MPDLIDVWLTAVLVVSALAVGWLAGRWVSDARLDRTADQILAELVADQIDDDRQALTSLPPGLLAGDVYAHAARRGISVREAASELFVAQARARLTANVRRHHGGGPP